MSLHESEVSRPALWFGLLGGGVAWTVHLLAAYLIAEFGCLSGMRQVRFLGVTAVAWLLIAVSLALIAVAVAAAIVSARTGRQLGTDERNDLEARLSEAFVARTGLITNALFVFIIAVESVPIFYFLKDC